MEISRRKLLVTGSLGLVSASLDPLDIVRGTGEPAEAAVVTAPEFPGVTTLDRTLVREDSGAYRRVVLGPGEPHLVRHDFTLAPTPQTNRSLLAFVQFSDLQIVDHESPLRVEFLDEFADGTGLISGTGSAYRPHEMLSTQLTDAMCQAIRRVRRAPATGLSLALTIITGDVVDNCQYNETRWYIDLLDGGVITPDSGNVNRDESHSSLAMIQGGDRGNRGRYWRPEETPWVGSSTSHFPQTPGLLAAARRQFTATGLGMPWYVAYGNHDGLVQGNLNITAGDWINDRTFLNRIATGDRKPVATDFDGDDGLGEVLKKFVLGGFLTNVVNVTADPGRRLLERAQFIQEHFNTTGTPAGHGFRSGSDRAYYTFQAGPDGLFQFICLDTVNTAFSFGSEGSIDETQWNWLEGLLKENSSRYEINDSDGTRANTVITQTGVKDRLIVVFCHHTLDTMTHTDNGWNDTSPRFNGNQLRQMLHRFPNVIALVNGHTHANNIWARHSAWPHVLGGGFWEINTASHIDWPIQSRIIEVAEDNGILSIFTTMVDAYAPLSNGGDLSTPSALAGLGRELATNDPQEAFAPNGGQPGVISRRGNEDGRNTQLLLPAPFPIPRFSMSTTAVARGQNGRLVMFAIDNAHGVWSRTQTAVGSDTWTRWKPFGGSMSSVVAETNGNGLIEVFGIRWPADSQWGGRVFHRWQLAPNSDSWSEWEEFGGRLSLVPSRLSVTASSTGGLVVFGINQVSEIWGRTQFTGSNGSNGQGSWSDWGLISALPATTVSRIAARHNSTGRLELFGIDTAGKVFYRWELTPGTGSWSSWVELGGSLPLPASIAATTIGPGGAVVLFGTDSSRRLWSRTQTVASNGSNGIGSWSAWRLIDGTIAGVNAVYNPSNRIELFGVDPSGNLFHRWELAAGTGSWSAWASQERP